MELRGYILIADITGYTSYLNESELDHARETLGNLLELLLDNTKPPLVISGLEGDAVFSYGLESGFVDPQTFLEMIENTYVSFRRAIELMVLNNTCRCKACANVSSLDLKFFVHHGTFVLQSVGESQELMGSDVNLAHRLLKNSVTGTTGIRAYTLFTEKAAESLGISDLTEEMVSHMEDVPDFGRIHVWIQDMHPTYEARRHERIIRFDPSEVTLDESVQISLQPELVWDYLTHSEFRNLTLGSDRFEIDRRGKRVGEGSVYQCYHGDNLIPQVVLEWRPFERMLVRQPSPIPGGEIHVEFELQPNDGGTLLTCRGARSTGSRWQRALTRVANRAMRPMIRRNLEKFKQEIEKAASGRDPLPGAILSRESIEAEAEVGLRAGET